MVDISKSLFFFGIYGLNIFLVLPEFDISFGFLCQAIHSGLVTPLGGYVFYENPNFVTYGWRYLEAAPSDIVLDGEYNHIFGYYRTIPTGTDTLVGGTGTGESNTAALVSKMGSTAYTSYTTSTTTTTGDYAARLCDLYEAGGYGDWFLPSKEELELMYRNLKVNNLGSFSSSYYWSSSEHYTYYACYQHFNNGNQFINYRYFDSRVRPVRAF